jgi:hypothetical protein
MLVTLIQRVISTFDEKLSPLNQTRGQQSREQAEKDLLKESGMHNQNCSTPDATGLGIALPKPPLAGIHNPKAKNQVCDRMRDNTGGQALRYVGDRVI